MRIIWGVRISEGQIIQAILYYPEDYQKWEGREAKNKNDNNNIL